MKTIKLFLLIMFIPFLGLGQDKTDNTKFYTKFKSQKGVVLIEKIVKSDTLKFNKNLKLVVNKKTCYNLQLPKIEYMGFWELKLIEKRFQQYRGHFVSTYEFILELDEVRNLIKLSEFIPNRKDETIKYESRYFQRIFLNLNNNNDFVIYFSKYRHNNSLWIYEKFNFQDFILIIETFKKLI